MNTNIKIMNACQKQFAYYSCLPYYLLTRLAVEVHSLYEDAECALKVVRCITYMYRGTPASILFKQTFKHFASSRNLLRCFTKVINQVGPSGPILKNLCFLGFLKKPKNLKSKVFKFFDFQVRIVTFSCQTL